MEHVPISTPKKRNKLKFVVFLTIVAPFSAVSKMVLKFLQKRDIWVQSWMLDICLKSGTVPSKSEQIDSLFNRNCSKIQKLLTKNNGVKEVQLISLFQGFKIHYKLLKFYTKNLICNCEVQIFFSVISSNDNKVSQKLLR